MLRFDDGPVDRKDLETFTDSLAHRGPDGRGVHIAGPVGLGHRRLAILDLSDGGAQPLSVLGSRYQIVYNGEVYNFLELRRELERAGHPFRSKCDAEVVAVAYHHWGPDCVLRFNGMWAFAIWDEARQELFLSRDRFGIKPLHVQRDGARFTFASELKAYRRLAGFAPRVNRDELRRALSNSSESVEESLLEGVRQLPAGHNMIVRRDGSERRWRWWSTLDHLPEVPRRFAEQVDEFRELFLDACRLRLRSDVPVATCLSGGVDSSAILCTVAKLRGTMDHGMAAERVTRSSQRAFVVVFRGTDMDEERYARAAIAQAGADAHVLPMYSAIPIDELRQYAFDFETIGVAMLLPSWAIYREMRRANVVVSLDGHGADELLAGYPMQLTESLRDAGSLVRRPRWTIGMARAITRMERGGRRRLLELLVEGDPALRFLSRYLRPARAAAAPPTSTWIPSWEGGDDWAALDGDPRIAVLPPLTRKLYRQFHHTSLPSILRKYDRLSMAHGIESRMPFMDWRLVTYAFALPDESKISPDGTSKRVLREAMRGIIPDVIVNRHDKVGFQAPIGSWTAASLGAVMESVVDSPAFLASDVWDGKGLSAWVHERRNSTGLTGREARRVWPFVQAQLWLDSFFADAAREPSGKSTRWQTPESLASLSVAPESGASPRVATS